MKVNTMQINITHINAFKDNYIWAIQPNQSQEVILVDPGQAEPCIEFIEQHNLTLKAILITHHHADHTGGIEALCEYSSAKNQSVTVFGPHNHKISGLDVMVKEGDLVSIDIMTADNIPQVLTLSVIDLPGHTLDHIAYFYQVEAEGELENNANTEHNKRAVFCGDTLFSGGCGRLFEGTPEQMFNSLGKLTALPADTAVYCTHEYTLANLHFSLAVEPNNIELIQYFNRVTWLRENGEISLPSSIAHELKINPFLRAEQPDIIQSASIYAEKTVSSPVEVFTAIRAWKDNF